jgi:ATP-binding cassette subfamily B protein
MTEATDDEDENGAPRRALSNGQVLGFIARFWLRRKGLFFAGVGLTLLAICFDLALPWASGRLIDTVTRGPSAVDAAWVAWRRSSASIWASR